ncbi:MAG: AbrB/MazE/SpoVT family DNA-binding domain-containing protein [Oscillospiraceae bacterium]|nr:AbrB/MazE/SpoVT family DNA-binding domain-containing protein [Oscillospiraceae bacterium]
MKATGIVRRIDDLGRVVIPKEIRRTMRIKEGAPLEIYTSNDGEVIFRKYSPINELAENASQAAEVMYKLGGAPAVIFDRDHVVAVAGVAKREYNERRVSPALEEIMETRRGYVASDTTDSALRPIEGIDKQALAVFPIVSSGDVTGAVAFVASENVKEATETQHTLAKATAMFLGKQIEE